jgi:hypothetical protein
VDGGARAAPFRTREEGVPEVGRRRLSGLHDSSGISPSTPVAKRLSGGARFGRVAGGAPRTRPSGGAGGMVVDHARRAALPGMAVRACPGRSWTHASGPPASVRRGRAFGVATRRRTGAAAGSVHRIVPGPGKGSRGFGDAPRRARRGSLARYRARAVGSASTGGPPPARHRRGKPPDYGDVAMRRDRPRRPGSGRRPPPAECLRCTDPVAGPGGRRRDRNWAVDRRPRDPADRRLFIPRGHRPPLG